MTARPPLLDRAERSADPARASEVLRRIDQARPGTADRLRDDATLGRRAVAVAAASGWLGRLLVTEPRALDVLADLDRPVAIDAGDTHELARQRSLEHLRIAARDLTDLDPLETVMADLTALAAAVLGAALRISGIDDLAVVGLGKAGGGELNYSSDVDVVLVSAEGDDDPRRARRLLDVAGRALRIDTDLRPGGRGGALVRSLAGYTTHWERWAEPWERQALLKARPLAGDPDLGARFVAAAAHHLWDRPFDADAIHQVRAMKARTERHATSGRDGDRDIKRTPGGIRDIEFSVQLLQLVHGPLDPALRVRGTLPALTALRDGGYVDAGDAAWLQASYRFLRRVEHAVQLDEDRQVHAVPHRRDERERLARVLGITDRPSTRAIDELDVELRACRATVRSIHERVYFRPLLDAFTRVDAPLTHDAAAARLSAFGFADAERLRQAVTELTRGLTRSSRLMARMLPLLLDWLSRSPDPDAGLLALRTLVARHPRAVEAAFRDSPETARRVCLLAGTSPRLLREVGREPDLLPLPPLTPDDDLAGVVARAVRGDAPRDDQRSALRRAVRRAQLRIAASDVLDDLPPGEVGRHLAQVARAATRVAVDLAAPEVPFAVLELGRLAGGELGYPSDLDLLFVFDGEGEPERLAAERAGEAVRRLLQGDGPVDRIYVVDLDLRPGGRAAPLVASRAHLSAHLDGRAEPWERLALARLRPLAGDVDLARRVVDEVKGFVRRPLADADVRAIRRVKARMESERIPPGDDPEFHLKLGPGALADVELTVALLLLDHGLPDNGTAAGIRALRAAGRLTGEEAGDLEAAHDVCVRARNRWALVADRPRESLPTGPELTTLARSLGTTSPELRDEYRRRTRRARRVVEHRFYGLDA